MKLIRSFLPTLCLRLTYARTPDDQRYQCCHALQGNAILGPKTFTAGSEVYEKRMTSYWSLNAALRPWRMVLPENTQDTSITMSILKAHQCPFGIRSGGHGIYAYANSIDDGVTIDFGRMSTVSFNDTSQLASLGPGNRWGDVYDQLAPHGVTVAGARGSSVGVAGFLLGGGNSFFSNTHGFGCDSVANFEVVLANGRIVHVKADENADLYQALKGGSGNFGLVTRFDMHTIKYPVTEPDGTGLQYGGFVMYNNDNSTVDMLIDNYDTFVTSVSSTDPESSTILSFDQFAGSTSASPYLLVHNTANNVNNPSFALFINPDTAPLITKSTLRSSTHRDLTDEISLVDSPIAAQRNVWFTSTYTHSPALIRYMLTLHSTFIRNLTLTLTPSSGFSTMALFQPLTSTQLCSNNSLNLQRFIRPDKPAELFLTTLSYSGSENDDAAVAAVSAFHNALDAEADRIGVFWDWRYLNYAHEDRYQKPIAGCVEEVEDFLRRVACRYDPEGVFQRLRGTGHKIV